ncbi:D-sedoheptulose 7-phosphate isomerase [Kribbella sp. VKM Ac-2527]|jgi:D-sedoheptulose 7-phosphate isomerase|uniref:D-sedoheptulose 7-phosphate isomerase n=1 Tax=Kribbella caucasensis TaxID=2512215 RepID=A0A4R6KCH8_9ACTN|nr:SIS domain-containing protein [Kribbella sp. VKM Ac-2527]TDO47972.1 D-sedoheptulose 7-phosphate isomerase [Kribbella sp. VKM Ac-2527]
MAGFGSLTQHLVHLHDGLVSLERQDSTIDACGRELADLLSSGHRLLAAGNGGSAAEAQHLTAELVGRFEAPDRPPLSAIALHAETSSLTAIGNDFGPDDIFARQVRAHGRPGDVLLLLSTSGHSTNLLTAATTARSGGLQVWAFTGPRPNPLAAAADRAVAVESPAPTAVQEVQLVAVHALCSAVERHLHTVDPHDLEKVSR